MGTHLYSEDSLKQVSALKNPQFCKMRGFIWNQSLLSYCCLWTHLLKWRIINDDGPQEVEMTSTLANSWEEVIWLSRWRKWQRQGSLWQNGVPLMCGSLTVNFSEQKASKVLRFACAISKKWRHIEGQLKCLAFWVLITISKVNLHAEEGIQCLLKLRAWTLEAILRTSGVWSFQWNCSPIIGSFGGS